jgi:hypothetical protein
VPRPGTGQAEQTFCSAPERAFEAGPADFDMGHSIRVVAVREPGAAVGSFAQDVRSLRGLEDLGGKGAGSSEIGPDG